MWHISSKAFDYYCWLEEDNLAPTMLRLKEMRQHSKLNRHQLMQKAGKVMWAKLDRNLKQIYGQRALEFSLRQRSASGRFERGLHP